MFLIYEIKQTARDYDVSDCEYLIDAFHRFFVEDLIFLGLCKTIDSWTQQSVFMDSGDWSKGYTTYFDFNSKNKYLAIDLSFKSHNPLVVKIIRQFKMGLLE